MRDGKETGLITVKKGKRLEKHGVKANIDGNDYLPTIFWTPVVWYNIRYAKNRFI